MNVDPEIRISTADDRDAILDLIARSGFNPRDAVTWDNLGMQAMTAWHENGLIGAIPFEPRELQCTASKVIRTIHETVVAIDPAHRSRGIGSQMQRVLCNDPPAGAQLITVFREEPMSPAYRWYQKNGFVPAMQIQSWFIDHPQRTMTSPRLWKADDPSIPWHLFKTVTKAGRVIRELKPWLAVHPYRNRYTFWIVADQTDSVALLGVGTMHSQSTRVDVLESISPSLTAFGNLVKSIATLARQNNWRPVRIPLATADPRTEILRSLNFDSRWTFHLLARSTTIDLSAVDFKAWTYAGIDYI